MRPANGIRKTVYAIAVACAFATGCAEKIPPYGVERPLYLPGDSRQTWAVAPVINLSGEAQVDPLLQADAVFQQLQQVQGLTAIPVNRVAEVYGSLHINQVQSQEQAALVCDLLGCDALLVASVTTYDPYNPPKFGASMQLFTRPAGFNRPAAIDPRELSRSAAPGDNESLPNSATFFQSAGVFDAANGSVREQLEAYAAGRHEPLGPLGMKEYYVNMDRYCGFVYHRLAEQILNKIERGRR